jgi:D-ribose pyranose/furanose isomerase RbsD
LFFELNISKAKMSKDCDIDKGFTDLKELARKVRLEIMNKIIYLSKKIKKKNSKNHSQVQK